MSSHQVRAALTASRARAGVRHVRHQPPSPLTIRAGAGQRLGSHYGPGVVVGGEVVVDLDEGVVKDEHDTMPWSIDPEHVCTPDVQTHVICFWQKPNYDSNGNAYAIPPVPGSGAPSPKEESCVMGWVEPLRSFKNHSQHYGTLYEGNNCTGRSKVVPRNSENPDIGFGARSFYLGSGV